MIARLNAWWERRQKAERALRFYETVGDSGRLVLNALQLGVNDKPIDEAEAIRRIREYAEQRGLHFQAREYLRSLANLMEVTRDMRQL